MIVGSGSNRNNNNIDALGAAISNTQQQQVNSNEQTSEFVSSAKLPVMFHTDDLDIVVSDLGSGHDHEQILTFRLPAKPSYLLEPNCCGSVDDIRSMPQRCNSSHRECHLIPEFLAEIPPNESGFDRRRWGTAEIVPEFDDIDLPTA
ncbi:hypothetical protein GLAREA_00939 [Glarea lozoyensis ATCC 20868]|uniref:Uncharacterized protein n=1 Tax=Glarea lozoyensis (strain ATCC 20868 / MF5171) TaxID=1116229 RepID=S3CXY2_GLAL2|nr:uncharacterized protein GLAREA_00939 [Glarea lozoyensis ATCC 20868]EPE29779.1 hypothetical protein GLAREA_00939 [Glarea lozoyensis ATCC 20868]